ncbi:tyrosine-type recombinase/integrase [Vibrio sp. VPAP30]|uniref:tyrosine-type recombinase/integrase n=1 Tax=Vibrio sp. VPAP30 TaxID=1647102 RepID=UPI000658A56F|nr:tyrosine-type recombinase/integrase [Vibrio sp. VPAP30]KLN66352.1 integrase [Vibrio sp. VPAP30]
MKLIDFSKADLSEDFEILEGIKFSEDSWRIQHAQSEHLTMNFDRITSQRDLSNIRDIVTIVKIFSYYHFPKKINLNITSWKTASSRFSMFVTTAKYFLLNKGLTTSRLLSNITQKQCRQYIDQCVEQYRNNVVGSSLKLSSAILFFDTWCDLTEKGLLPSQLTIPYSKHSIINKKLRSEIHQLKEASTSPWSPLSADVIKSVFDESVKYIQELSPTIIECSNLIRNRGRLGQGQSYGAVRQDGKTKKLFKTLQHIQIPEISNGVMLYDFKPITKIVSSLGYSCGWQYRTTINITEIRPSVIKLKRCCIFIIALFTGLRREEIAELKAKRAYKKNGDLYLDIIRYKTAKDDEGESDSIPVPVIVRDAIDVLLKLFEDNRTKLNSDYLLVSDIINHKKYKKIKLDTIGKDIKALIAEITGIDDAHTHQLRKTIAWLLISKSESNIELIRQLFGHKSYGMTMRYILRNELMVQSVVELIEHNYTEDLVDIFEEIANNNTYGRLSVKMKKRFFSRHFKGQILTTDIEDYVRTSLEAGVPLFVSKVPIGGFCLKTGDDKSVPPCMEVTGSSSPDIEFCDYKKCPHILLTEDAINNIEAQLNYYKQKLKYIDGCINPSVAEYYENQVISHKQLLEKLSHKASTPNAWGTKK